MLAVQVDEGQEATLSLHSTFFLQSKCLTLAQASNLTVMPLYMFSLFWSIFLICICLSMRCLPSLMHAYTLYGLPFVLKCLYLRAHTLFRDLLIEALS